MVKFIDIREREEDILKLVIDSYIQESKPISSAYICEKYRPNCSSATIRNIMLSLENQGFLSHIYTSSGRVPTTKGFKHYVEQLSESLDSEPDVHFAIASLSGLTIEKAIDHSLDALAQLSGYTSLIAVSGQNDRLFFKGVRFMLEQPEFEDVERFKNILYALEVRVDELGNLLSRCVGNKIKILIGEDIGFDEISSCSLLISGLKEKQVSLALALLGPIRMNYAKAASSLRFIQNQLKEVVEAFI